MAAAEAMGAWYKYAPAENLAADLQEGLALYQSSDRPNEHHAP